MSSTSVEITAGLGGFLVLFGLMLAVWFLGRDMTKRLRRMRLAEDERVAAVLRERAEQQAGTGRPVDGPKDQDGQEEPAAENVEVPDEGRAGRRRTGDDPIG